MTGGPTPGTALAGRVALVTGVSRRVGIGTAVSRRLAGLGAALFLTSWAAHDREQPWGADPGGVDAVLAELRTTVVSPEQRVEQLEADDASWVTGQVINSEGGFRRFR